VQKGLGSLSTLLVLGLGMGVVRNLGNLPVAPAQTTAQPSKTPKTNSENLQTPPSRVTTNCPDPCPQDLIDTIAASSAVNQTGEDYSKLQGEFASLKAQDSEFIIATVADPVHTHLSLFFDRTIDSIQQGAQETGWIFDRAKVPWDNKEHPESANFKVRKDEEDEQKKKEYWPGLMIFRKANSEDPTLEKFLYVFLVAETPTGGINRRQFRAAEAIIKEAAKASDPTKNVRLSILGPTFSGSLYSLEQLIAENKTSYNFKQVTLRSGTVSSWQTMQWFHGMSHNGATVDFATFQHNDRYLLRRFLEFEKHRGYDPSQIAVLTEDETAYGDVSPPYASNGGSASPAPDSAELANDESQVLQLYFPRDISELRSVYQQGYENKTAVAAENEEYKIRTTLPQNLEDTGNDDDSVAQFAHSETPLSQEAILLRIVAALRKQHIQFVVLQATNPIDTLFLSGFLKKGDSDARVVTMPGDLLLSRDVDDVSLLHGVMALTTYSLLPDIDEEVEIPQDLARTRIDHVFPSAYSTGIYNATISLVESIEGLPVSSPCNDAADHCTCANRQDTRHRYSEYGWPAIGGKATGNPLVPPVWLTVLGKSGFWPLAVLDGTNPMGNVSPSPCPLNGTGKPGELRSSNPLFFRIVCGSVVSLMLLCVVFLIRGTVNAGSSTMTLMAPVVHPQRCALIVIMGWLFTILSLLLIWPWCSASIARWEGTVGLAIILTFCGYWTSGLVERHSSFWGGIFIAGAGFLFLVLLAAISMERFFSPPFAHSGNAFLYRYIHLTSGVSPLLPLLLLVAGAIWWCWCSLSGLPFVDDRRPRLPRVEALKAAPEKDDVIPAVRWGFLSESFAIKLASWMLPISTNWRVTASLTPIMIVVIFTLDYYHPLLSLETRHFEWIYFVALFAGAVTLFYSLFQMSFVWMEFHRTLASLNRLPLRRAFDKLGFSWNPIWSQEAGRWQDLYRLVSRQIETLVHLKKELELEDSDETRELRSKIESSIKIHNNLGSVMAEQAEPTFSKIAIERYAELQTSLADTCGATMAYLNQTEWWEDEGMIFSEVGSEKSEKEKDEDDADVSLTTRLAERFCALIYLNFILSVVLRLKTLVLTVAGLYVFLLLSADSYPFEPKTALRSGAIFMLLFVVAVVAYVSAQLHRDSILSLVTQTTPGELGMEFYVKMASFVALPLLSLLVSQFPSLNNALFSWLEPAMNALK
jgi:hypothetical protein